MNHRPLGYEPNRTNATCSESTGVPLLRIAKKPPKTPGFGPKLVPTHFSVRPVFALTLRTHQGRKNTMKKLDTKFPETISVVVDRNDDSREGLLAVPNAQTGGGGRWRRFDRRQISTRSRPSTSERDPRGRIDKTVRLAASHFGTRAADPRDPRRGRNLQGARRVVNSA